jgi:predicted SprT family Zn-dependent metalloprotease
MKTLHHKIEIVTDKIWSDLIESYPKLVRFDAPKIVLCNRLTRTAGKSYQTENRIHLANKFFIRNHREMMLTILPHEIAHQADFNLFGESEKKCGHGKKWAKIMVELGLPANKYHSLEI